MKRDIITKKHNLCRKSFELRSAKFQLPMTREKISILIREQDKIYKQYIFYKEYLKAYEKEKRK